VSDATVRATTAIESESLTGRVRRGLSNPWGRPRFLVAFTWLYVAWSIVPVLIAILFSFNNGRSRSAWQGFSVRWWTGDPDLSVLHDPSLRSALFQSAKLAALTMLIATPIGVALAIGLARWRGRGARPANLLMLLPLVTPELVMGVSLFLVFVYLFPFVHLGTGAQLLGHVTFSISFVVIVTRGRLFAVGREYEEAAMDLGASRLQALWYVLLPILRPAILVGAVVSVALSLDDFVISQFLVGGSSSVTIPVLVYSASRAAPTPATNAIATLLLVSTLLLAIVAGVILHRARKREARTGSAIEDLARLEV
jgi:spermidine/putrescine transport system permease protein